MHVTQNVLHCTGKRGTETNLFTFTLNTVVSVNVQTAEVCFSFAITTQCMLTWGLSTSLCLLYIFMLRDPFSHNASGFVTCNYPEESWDATTKPLDTVAPLIPSTLHLSNGCTMADLRLLEAETN